MARPGRPPVESDIAKEIEKVASVRKAKRDTHAMHRKKLVFAVANLTDKQWDKLSDGAQRWFNDAVAALNSGRPLPSFPDEDEVKARRRQLAAKSGTNRQSNAKKRQRGASDRIKDIMLHHGCRITPVEIMKILETEGYKCSMHTVKLVRAEFRRALQILSEKDMLKEVPKDL